MHSPSPFEFWLGAHYAQLAAQAGWRASSWPMPRSSVLSSRWKSRRDPVVWAVPPQALRTFCAGTNLTLGGGLQYSIKRALLIAAHWWTEVLRLTCSSSSDFEDLYRCSFPLHSDGNGLLALWLPLGGRCLYRLLALPSLWHVCDSGSSGSSVTGVNAGFKLFF